MKGIVYLSPTPLLVSEKKWVLVGSKEELFFQTMAFRVHGRDRGRRGQTIANAKVMEEMRDLQATLERSRAEIK